ncbi:hypothetical protein LCGC14_0540550 [marine sediment metagenome]|uniref:NAD(P)-binding domain-containing protein n=1 Tax=marine sediment metagenome TaxID=412755 RepID=A0A0F9SBD4_9ZZZZ
MRILITGISGFAASHLARKLLSEGHEVHGTVRTRSDLSNIKDIKDKLQLHLIEMTDSFAVDNVVNGVQPEEIYHLAAQSYVKLSWDAPIETYRINVDGTINLFESVRKLKISPRILVTSTSEVYGEVNGAINEETIPNPITHYGISKYAQDMIARLYARSYNLKVVVTRAFNITGAGRADVFVDSSFAKQIAEIEKGKEPLIEHGNLESERDFVSVHDVIDGYIKALRSERWGEIFCLGSGKPVKIKGLLDSLIKLSTYKGIRTKVDKKRLRPTDTKSMKCDYSKAKRILGWKPKVPIEDSLEELLNYWRND